MLGRLGLWYGGCTEDLLNGSRKVEGLPASLLLDRLIDLGVLVAFSCSTGATFLRTDGIE